LFRVYNKAPNAVPDTSMSGTLSAADIPGRELSDKDVWKSSEQRYKFRFAHSNPDNPEILMQIKHGASNFAHLYPLYFVRMGQQPLLKYIPAAYKQLHY